MENILISIFMSVNIVFMQENGLSWGPHNPPPSMGPGVNLAYTKPPVGWVEGQIGGPNPVQCGGLYTR